jgi:hypothetical protein
MELIIKIFKSPFIGDMISVPVDGQMDSSLASMPRLIATVNMVQE